MKGLTFGRWLVVDEEESDKKVLCKCSCGNEKKVNKYTLTSGRSKSCGCSNKDLKSAFKHGFGVKDRLYRIWIAMNTRCNNPNIPQYHDYGGRGINVCDEWKSNFETFRQWAMCNGYLDTLSIDRIDFNGNYTPDNCRWATKQEQDSNKRSNIHLMYEGENITLAELSRRTGHPYDRLRHRYHRGIRGDELLAPSRYGTS
jgi:hypothetical protein